MKIREVPPVKPYFPQEDIRQIQDDVQKILESGRLTLGDYTKRFEAEFAETCRVKHAVAVNSGTSALEISLRALGLSNNEVLVPTNTFSATAATVIFACYRFSSIVSFHSLLGSWLCRLIPFKIVQFAERNVKLLYSSLLISNLLGKYIVIGRKTE